LAAYFQQQGYRLLCDDVCVISFDEAGQPLAWPGVPRLKLWADALQALKRSTDGLSRIGFDIDKYHVPVQSYATGGPLPLENIYRLDFASAEHPAGITHSRAWPR